MNDLYPILQSAWAHIQPYLIAGLTTAGGYLLVYLTGQVHSIIDKARAATAAQRAANDTAFLHAKSDVLDAVASIEEQFAKAAREAGPIDAQKGSELLAKAKAIALPRVSQLIGHLGVDVEKWLEAQIPAQLARLKIMKQAGPAALPQTGAPVAGSSLNR